MKFVATEDIRAPADRVWAAVSDIDRFEVMLAARAQRLERRPPGPAAPGTRWEGRAKVRGRARDVSAELVDLQAPERMAFEGGTEGMRVTVEAAVAARGPDLTRLTVTTEARAQTLAARLLLQSAKLARATLAKRYKQRVSDFAARLEAGGA